MKVWVLPGICLLRVSATAGFRSVQLNFIAKNNGLNGDSHEYCS